jgi:Domain of unknown function (DUF4214)
MMLSWLLTRVRRHFQATPPNCRRRPRRLWLEPLEERRLLAGNVTITSVTIPQATEGLLSSPALTADFTDTSGIAAAGLSATIDYGDGTALATATVTKTGATSYTVTDAHTFPEESGSTVPPGAFTVTLHVFETATAATNTDTNVSQAQVLDAPLSPGNPVSPGTPQTFSGVGGNSTTGGALAALQSFEAAIDGANNGANPPAAPLTTGFRDINWDGVKLDGTDFGGPPNTTVIDAGKTAAIPLDRFQERGVFFGAVYAVSSDTQAGGSFADVNPNAAGLFQSFSPHNTFAMFNDNGIDFKFVVPSPHTTAPVSAASRGFGAIFINNQQLGGTAGGSSTIEYFHGSTSLGKFTVPAGAPGQAEFLGVLFQDPIVTNVFITCGTDVIFKFDGTTFTSSGVKDDPTHGHNLVVTDDFVYPEPVAIANGFPIVSGPAGTTNAAAAVNAVAGQPFTGVVATFSDADPNANAKDFTATINWGDGHLTNGTITANAQGGFDVSGTNTYASPGRFPISVDVADFGGGPGLGGSSPTQSVINTANVSAGDQNQRFLAQVYQDLLGRTVDPNGLAFFGGQLDGGLLNRTQVVQQIENSLEFHTVEVNAAYQAILHRQADPGGLSNFVQFLNQGGTAAQVQQLLFSSQEFFDLSQKANTTLPAGNQRYVDLLFQDILNRHAEAGALSGFGGQLDNGVSRSAVAAAVLTSPEGEQDLVNGFYQKFLHRQADSAGLNGFTGALQSGAHAEDVIAALVASDEYFSKV